MYRYLSDAHLVFLQPFLQQLLPALLQNRSREFDRLEVVELSLLEQYTEILKYRRKATRGSRCLLECFDDLCRTQDTLDEKQVFRTRMAYPVDIQIMRLTRGEFAAIFAASPN